VATDRKPLAPRTRPRRAPRVSGDEAKQTRKNVLDEPKQRQASPSPASVVPIGSNGLPMIEITVQASETVPVAQYANVVVGPIAIRRWIEDPQDDDALRAAVDHHQDLVEGIVSEDRDLVQQSVAAYNRQKEEQEKGKK
jgi:hypothetical protein